MPKFACNVCKENYPDSQTLLKHFSANHAATKCHLCNRESCAEKGSFCLTCRTAFPQEIADVEAAQNRRAEIEQSLKQLDKKISRAQVQLREVFLTRQKELFCSHLIPKADKCEKCEMLAAKFKPSSQRPIIRINLDDFPAQTLAKKTRINTKTCIRVTL